MDTNQILLAVAVELIGTILAIILTRLFEIEEDKKAIAIIALVLAAIILMFLKITSKPPGTGDSSITDSSSTTISDSSIEVSSNAITYEDIYGTLVFEGVDNARVLYGNKNYLEFPTGYKIYQYFLEDINNDAIKELILEIHAPSGTDEAFRECFTYKNDEFQWCGTYSDIYMTEECFHTLDGNGLIVATGKPMLTGYEFRYWNPLDSNDNRVYSIRYIGDLNEMGQFDTDLFNLNSIIVDIPDDIRNQLGNKLIAYFPSDRSPLQEQLN